MKTLGFGSALRVETDDSTSPRWINLRVWYILSPKMGVRYRDC